MKGAHNAKQTDYIQDMDLYKMPPSVDTSRRGFTKALSELQKSLLEQGKKVCIYGLKDPQTEKIMYVGRTINLKQRIQEHLMNGYGSRGLAAWVRSLKDKGRRPIVQILEVTTQEEWSAREYCWIRHYRRLGHPLLNHMRGGLVCLEWKRKMPYRLEEFAGVPVSVGIEKYLDLLKRSQVWKI